METELQGYKETNEMLLAIDAIEHVVVEVKKNGYGPEDIFTIIKITQTPEFANTLKTGVSGADQIPLEFKSMSIFKKFRTGLQVLDRVVGLVEVALTKETFMSKLTNENSENSGNKEESQKVPNQAPNPQHPGHQPQQPSQPSQPAQPGQQTVRK